MHVLKTIVQSSSLFVVIISVFSFHQLGLAQVTTADLEGKIIDEKGMPLEKVNIIVEGADNIIEIYTHPPSLSVSRQENKIIIQGSIEKNKLLEIEMLLRKDVLNILDGFPKKFDDVRELFLPNGGIAYYSESEGAWTISNGFEQSAAMKFHSDGAL